MEIEWLLPGTDLIV